LPIETVVIYLGQALLLTSSGLFTRLEKNQPMSLPCFRPGFTEPTPLDVAGALLPHLCTLTFIQKEQRRYFSVALSSRSLALGVTQQVWSLRSPDFPQWQLKKLSLQPPRQLSLYTDIKGICQQWKWSIVTFMLKIALLPTALRDLPDD
jgi:hypothetical protein